VKKIKSRLIDCSHRMFFSIALSCFSVVFYVNTDETDFCALTLLSKKEELKLKQCVSRPCFFTFYCPDTHFV